jgi:Tfp pilus assembly protein PilX
MDKQRGFVMADAMIALVLISLLLVALLGMNRNSAAMAAKAENRLAAGMIAQSVLEDPDLSGDEGELVINDRSYRWTREIDDATEASRPRLKLEEIRVTVSWQDNRVPRQLELKSARVRGLP